MIHLNQRTFLTQKIKEFYPEIEFDVISDSLKGISEDKYRILLAMGYNKQINNLRLELIKLGVNVNV